LIKKDIKSSYHCIVESFEREDLKIYCKTLDACFNLFIFSDICLIRFIFDSFDLLADLSQIESET
jgi:hypothetical protein